jgi:hypothetical protein
MICPYCSHDFPICSHDFPIFSERQRANPRCFLREIPLDPHLHLETDWGIGAVELLNGSGKPSARWFFVSRDCYIMLYHVLKNWCVIWFFLMWLIYDWYDWHLMVCLEMYVVYPPIFAIRQWENMIKHIITHFLQMLRSQSRLLTVQSIIDDATAMIQWPQSIYFSHKHYIYCGILDAQHTSFHGSESYLQVKNW